MSVKNRILEYLRLFRFQAGAVEATIILIGALVMGQRDFSLLLIVFFIGIFGHICGYVLNDYADVKVDKKSYELKEKPLVSGVIPKRYALIISILAAFITYALTLIFFPYLRSIFLLSLATILTIVYDFFGKKIPGSDFIVAGTIALFCLFGASTVPLPFTNITYIVCLLFFFDIVFINVVEGGVKDVDHDYLAGGKTIATRIGVKVKEGRLMIPRKFTAFAYTLKAIYFGLILLLGFQPELNIWYSNQYVIHIIVILLIIIIIITSYKFLHLSIFDRSKMKRLYSGINSASGALILIMLLPILGLEITLVLLLLPITWYIVFNFILYGKGLEPRV